MKKVVFYILFSLMLSAIMFSCTKEDMNEFIKESSSDNSSSSSDNNNDSDDSNGGNNDIITDEGGGDVTDPENDEDHDRNSVNTRPKKH